MNKIKLIIDFFRLWILWGDRKEAWQDAKINNDPTFQEEMQEFDDDYFEEPFISKEFIEFIERQELLDVAHKNYVDQTMFSSDPTWFKAIPCMEMLTGEETIGARQYAQDEFINKCKTDLEFSEKWGLKIEERELNLDERAKLHPNPENFYEIHGTFSISDSIEDSNFPYKDWLHEQFDNGGIPTKLITITYNDQKIESYE